MDLQGAMMMMMVMMMHTGGRMLEYYRAGAAGSYESQMFLFWYEEDKQHGDGLAINASVMDWIFSLRCDGQNWTVCSRNPSSDKSASIAFW